MFLHVSEAKYLYGYTLWLRFNDGTEGEVDLEPELNGEVFGPLLDPVQFQTFRVDPEIRTVVWKNGADFAPEFLRDCLRVLA
ncbi:MAG: DUF2442 domain-containing protein [Candidatus Hydrogenedentes bacterium]|nr:DUF2442 domain-containing protein [Candidatus Hydrogenedentota bacterium]